MTDYFVRADGTAANKGAATDSAAAATSMSLATFNGETFSAGDTVYFSSRGGVFYGRAVLPTASVTYAGETGYTPTFSNSVSLDGAASFSDATTYAVTGYAWSQVAGSSVWKKDCGALPQIVTEDDEYLTPILGHGRDEATIVAAMSAGTYAIQTGSPNVLYYWATDSGAPSAHAIRMNNHANDSSLGTVYATGKAGLTIQNMRIRMQYVAGVDTIGNSGLSLVDCTGFVVDDITADACLSGIGIDGGNGYLGPGVVCEDNMGVGLAVQANTNLTALKVSGGIYRRSNRAPAVATNAQTVGYVFDGDGIGIGHDGGTITGVVIDNAIVEYNGPPDGDTTVAGAGVYVGTASAMDAGVSVTRCIIRYNHGAAINLNDWSGGNIDSNVCYNNVNGPTSGTNQYAVFADCTDASFTTASVCNNLFASNGGVRTVSFNADKDDISVVFRNNVFYNNAPYVGTWVGDAILYPSARDNIYEGGNCFYWTTASRTAIYRGSAFTYTQITSGTWAAASTNTGTGTIFTDPQLDVSYRPQASACMGSGTWASGVRGIDDLPLPLHPDMGPWQDRTAPGRQFGSGGGSL